MKYPGMALLVLLMVMNLETLCLAQCNPRILSFPPAQIRGDLKCMDMGYPIDPTAIELIVDGVLCPDIDWDFYYPFLHDGYYKIEFWIDNTREHTISICVEGSCRGDLVTGGFSDDGTTSYPCTNTVLFPQFEMMIAQPVILPSATLPSLSELPIIMLCFILSILIMMSMRSA